MIGLNSAVLPKFGSAAENMLETETIWNCSNIIASDNIITVNNLRFHSTIVCKHEKRRHIETLCLQRPVISELYIFKVKCSTITKTDNFHTIDLHCELY